ncbi:hypothetical protein [Pseudoalteromonas xiamenensis]
MTTLSIAYLMLNMTVTPITTLEEQASAVSFSGHNLQSDFFPMSTCIIYPSWCDKQQQVESIG